MFAKLVCFLLFFMPVLAKQQPNKDSGGSVKESSDEVAAALKQRPARILDPSISREN